MCIMVYKHQIDKCGKFVVKYRQTNEDKPEWLMKKKSLIYMLIIMAALILSLAQTAYADTYTKYEPVKTGQLTADARIRAGAGTSYTVLGTCSKGEKITLKGYRKASDGKVWYRMTYSGKAAYVSSVNVKIVSSLSYTIYTPVGSGRVTGSYANVRASASSSGTLRGKLHKYDYFTVTGEKTASDGTVWYRLSFNGQASYVSSKTTSIVSSLVYSVYSPYKTGTVTASGVNVRSGAATSYKVYGKFTKNQKVTVRGEKINSSTGTKWYRILYDGKAAYVSSVNITLDDAPLEYNTFTPEKAGNIDVSSANVRKSPSVSASSAGTLSKNRALRIKGYVYGTDGRCWYFVTDGNIQGYTVSSNVRKITLAEGSSSEYVKAAATVNVRSGAGTSYSVIGSMSEGASAVCTGSAKDSSGTVWYKITYGSVTGYVISTYTSKTVTSSEGDAYFEAQLIEQEFPESYIPYLRTMHALHPEWVFKAQHVGMSWTDALNAQTKVGRSLVNTSYSAWKSMAEGAYDWTNGRYVTFDSGNWVTAHSYLVKYYLDPRNFINDSYIYMFLDHGYDSDTQTLATVKKVVSGTFLDGIMPGTGYTYAYYINKAGREAGMNPNVLASMILQEQGTSGNSNLISGTCYGYEGLYNYLNIGAYAASGMTAVQRGLWWAAGAGTGATSYNRPWNTRYKAILGGAEYYAGQYIKNKQNTLYLKKFNVTNGVSNAGLHQYMTNIQGAAAEAAFLKSAYSGFEDIPMSFSIPVYTGMPSSACPLPTTQGTNNNFLTSVTVKGSDGKSYQISPAFYRYTNSYQVTVPKTVKSLTVTVKKSASAATVTGDGTVTLGTGTETISIKVKSTSGKIRTYKITVNRS